jgi:calcium-dependent protein kinase
MGNAYIRCDAGFGGNLSCSSCRNADDVHAKLKLCSWAEEEVTTTNGDPMINLDYGCLAVPTPILLSSSTRPPLYDPGSLIPLHGGDHPCDQRNSIHAAYLLDSNPLGKGSYGEVILATHRSTGARRAVKLVGKAGLKRYVSNVTGFVRREVDILRRLDHPNIVRIYEAYEDENNIYLVLELCEGGDLLERVAVAQPRLPEREAAVLFMQMLSSVQHLCLRGVVHRDLKPENFLFGQREPEREPLPPELSPIKLIDFGLSRRLSSEAGARMTPKIGTTEYMAPEAFAGRVNAALADRTDMWSMGVVLHVIFMGHFPSARLAEQTPEEYLSAPCWSRVSNAGRDLLAQLLRYEPARRPTVTLAMKHTWLNSALNVGKLTLIQPMTSAVQQFAQSLGIRKLALAAAARELDDRDVRYIRYLHETLELECDGHLTRPALERVANSDGPTKAIAAELRASFDCIDLDGSGALDWTELLAISLGIADKLTLCNSKEEGVDGAAADEVGSGMPALHDSACWRAFDLLGQGSDVLSGHSLGRLFVPVEADAWLAKKGGTAGGGTGGSDDGIHQIARESHRMSDLDSLVREVEPKGEIDTKTFQKMLLA